MTIRLPRVIAAALALGLAGALSVPVSAHPSDWHASPEWTGTLDERLAQFLPQAAHAQTMAGPTRPIGIAVETLGRADLTGELPGLENRLLRARLWTMEPGGVVPVHSHADRPAYILVLEGTVVEHRSDDDEPHVFGPGDLSVEDKGVVHWWENTGDVRVTMIVIDLFHQN